jgi:hypothetical protein
MTKIRKIKKKKILKKKSFNKLIRECKLNKRIKEKIKEILKSDEKDLKIFYTDAWQIIHSIHILQPNLQLQIFFKILQKFTLNECICGHDAHIIFMALLNENKNYFYNIESKMYQEFWVYFHNLINLKLDKIIYPSITENII